MNQARRTACLTITVAAKGRLLNLRAMGRGFFVRVLYDEIDTFCAQA
jgi:hypothetical protein